MNNWERDLWDRLAGWRPGKDALRGACLDRIARARVDKLKDRELIVFALSLAAELEQQRLDETAEIDRELKRQRGWTND